MEGGALEPREKNGAKRRSRCRSSQQARSALRSLLLDSDDSDGADGGPAAPLPGCQAAHALVDAIGVQGVLLTRQAAPGAQVTGVVAPAAAAVPYMEAAGHDNPPTDAARQAADGTASNQLTVLNLLRVPGSRMSNASYVAETPLTSPLAESVINGIPATPTEELDLLAYGVPADALPYQGGALRAEHQLAPAGPEQGFQQAGSTLTSDLPPGAAPQPAPPLRYHEQALAIQHAPAPQVADRSNPWQPLRQQQQQFHQQQAGPGGNHLRPAASLGLASGAHNGGDGVHWGGFKRPAEVGPEPSRPTAGAAAATALCTPATLPLAPSAPAVKAAGQGQPQSLQLLSPTRARLPQQPMSSMGSPAAPASKATTTGFASLPLSKSPIPVNATANSGRSPAQAANRQSPLGGTHYPGLALQSSKPSPLPTAALPVASAGGAVVGPVPAASSTTGDAHAATMPGGYSGGSSAGKAARARVKLSDRLHACAAGLGISPAGSSGAGQLIAPRVTTVALPPLHLVPGGRAPGGDAGGMATPLLQGGRHASVAAVAKGAAAGGRAGGDAGVGHADRTPACQPVKGLLGATNGPPSSNWSTPFDDDMLAALDSLERRANNAAAAAVGEHAAATGAEPAAASLASRLGSAAAAQGDGLSMQHIGAQPVPPAGHSWQVGKPTGHAAPPAGGSAAAGAPIITAFELMRQQERELGPHGRGQGTLPPPAQYQQRQLADNAALAAGKYAGAELGARPQPAVGLPANATHNPPGGLPVQQSIGFRFHTGVETDNAAVGQTPEVAIKGAPALGAAGAPVDGSKAEPTPEIESAGLLAALDELEARHMRAAAGAEAVGAACAAAEPQQPAADAAAGPSAAAAGNVSVGPAGATNPSPLPVKQLAFTPMHGGQPLLQHQLRGQGLHPGVRAPAASVVYPPPHSHSVPDGQQQQAQYQWQRAEQEAGPLVGRGGQQQEQAQQEQPRHGVDRSGGSSAPHGLPPRPPVSQAQRQAPQPMQPQQPQRLPQPHQQLAQGQANEERRQQHQGPQRSDAPQAQAGPGTGAHGSAAPGNAADGSAPTHMEAQAHAHEAAAAAGPAFIRAVGVAADDSSSSDDEEAEAYAAPMTQRAVAEAHRRQSRRSSLQAGGSQLGTGNLANSLAAAAGDAGGDAGGGAAEAADGVTELGEDAEPPPPVPPQQLEAYLPEPLCQAYYDRGGRFELYQWQAECLCQLGVLMGRNLVYCAPTSGGKSMVAEVLGIRRLLTTGKPFMLVLPFVALCAEKADALQALLAPINRTVNSAYGGQQSGKIIQPGVGAIVATIEKANMLVNAMLEEDTLGELSAVIIDELHMVGEEERGYLLELLLTKLRFATSASAGGGEAEEEPFDWTAVGPAYQRDGLQVIGMSATMPNVDVVARWLDAALYTTNFRPVHLQEYAKVGRRILDSSGQLVRELAVEPGWEERDTDHVALLTRETVQEGHSVLIFCASKLWCEKVAEHIARMVVIAQRGPPPVPPAIGAGPGGAQAGEAASPSRNARDAFVAELRRLSGSDPTLPDLVARGVAYHHAGLSNEERDIVESAYKAGAISVLTATSTLAAGVNLPARRVIFRHSYIGKQDNPIDATKYRQMSGRAGRAGIDSAGESYLICERSKPVANLLALMQQKANPIASCLTETKKGMKRAVLEVVASGAVSSGTDVKRFIGCTLLHAQFGFQAVAKATIAALHWLKDSGFIRVDEATLNWGPTPFGKATLASSMPPEEALVVRGDLERARQSLVLATDLHVTYLVTPIKEDLRVDWEIYFHWFEKLAKVDARVAELVGVVPGYLVRLRQGHRGARGGAGGASSADAEKERIARRFFAAMVLNDLIQEVPLKEVAEKYGLGKEKGPLEGLQERAGRFAAMVAAFCERLGWSDLEVIIAKFQSRVWYGVRPEVVALTEIPYVKGHRARLLFKAGLRTPEAVAGCDLDRLVEILSAGAPRNPEQEEQQRRTERRAARMILQGAKDLVNQKVQELKQQARALRAAMDPTASQAQSTPLDPSLAPPQPPPQPRQPQGYSGSAPQGTAAPADGDRRGVDAGQAPAAAESTSAAPHVGAPLDGNPGQVGAGGASNAAAAPTAADNRPKHNPATGTSGAISSTPERPPKQPRTGASPAGHAAALAASPGRQTARPEGHDDAASGAVVQHAAQAGQLQPQPHWQQLHDGQGPAQQNWQQPQHAQQRPGQQQTGQRGNMRAGDSARQELGQRQQGLQVQGPQQQAQWPQQGQQQPLPQQGCMPQQQQGWQQEVHQRQGGPGGSNVHGAPVLDAAVSGAGAGPTKRAGDPVEADGGNGPDHKRARLTGGPPALTANPALPMPQAPLQASCGQGQQAQGHHVGAQPHQQQQHQYLQQQNQHLQAHSAPQAQHEQQRGVAQWEPGGRHEPGGQRSGHRDAHQVPNHQGNAQGAHPQGQQHAPPCAGFQHPQQPHQHQQQQHQQQQPHQYQHHPHQQQRQQQQHQWQQQQQQGQQKQSAQVPSSHHANGNGTWHNPPSQTHNPYLARQAPGPSHPQGLSAGHQPPQQQPNPAVPHYVQPGWPPPHQQMPQHQQQQQRPLSPALQRVPPQPHQQQHTALPITPSRSRPTGQQYSGGRNGEQRGPPPPSPTTAQPWQQQQQQQQPPRSPQPWPPRPGPGAAPPASPTAAAAACPPDFPGQQEPAPLLRVPGFTVLKTAAEAAAVCEQLKRVGMWGFALDFADSASAPVSANPGLQLPGVPQVALGRGILTNSIGLPLHYDMEAAEDGAPVAPQPVLGAVASAGRLEGIALSAFDGCALYVPLVATEATGGGSGGGGGPSTSAREAAAVWHEVRQLLAHTGSTKVTFELKQQLLSTGLADGSAICLPAAPSPPSTSGAGVHAAAGAFSAALAASAAVPGAAAAGAPATAATAQSSASMDVAGPVVDVRILLWMLNPDDPVNLPRGKSGKLTATKGLEERMKQPEVCGSSAHVKALGVLNCAGTVVRQLPTRQADACRRAAMVRRIFQDKLPRLQSEGLLRPLLEVEMPLVRVLAGMEAAGVALAPAVLRSQRGPLEARLRQLAHKAHVAAGMTFDLNSPKDVSEVLFQHLGLPPPPCAFTSQHQKHPSTKKEVLEELEESTRHPILRPLLDYRSLHKLLTGFVETLYATAKGQWLKQQAAAAAAQQQQQLQQQQAGQQGQRAVRDAVVPEVVRLCGTWLHTATATGRLAMDEPNLQTIPRPVEYTFALSQESGEVLPLEAGAAEAGGAGGPEGGPRTVTLHFNLRNAFVAPPGHVILAADYKQIELRLMAHFSRDTALCSLLRNPNHDPFTLLAAEWKRLPVEQVTPDLRVQAKRLAYGMLYGMGTSTLAAELGVTVAEAGELSDNFRRAIPGVDRWTKEVVEECRNCGYVVTLMGRRRYFPRINERSCKDARSYRAQSERQAVNSVCQGSAADLVKAAMVTLQRRLAGEGLAGRARMVLMVHDELVFEVEAQLLPAVAALVRQVLEGEVALSVPLPVKLSAGPSWGQLQEYEPPS